MWKPVRLQGVGAASTIINGDTHPSGVIDPWRHQISCLFGLALNGQPYTGNGPNGGTNPYDASNQPSNGGLSCPGNGWNYFGGQPGVPQVDRIPFEGILGWDTTVNGNLAEMLQEPTLMGSYEGAGITVLSQGRACSRRNGLVRSGSRSRIPGRHQASRQPDDCLRERRYQSVPQQLPLQPVAH